MDAGDFFAYASSCLGVSEAGNRTAASRAYYTVYHACFEYAYEQLSFEIHTNSGFHQQLINCYHRQPERALRTIGGLLKLSKEIRVQADYNLDAPFKRIEAEKNMRYCVQILNELKILKKKDKTVRLFAT
ncbi:hypothetical protein [Paralysiella testudinis]|uniref:HEPN domain-containing protein n=1 Tax=Paralysiella testudinis TaxID=2809020 RepID=A0A892ZI41_9NEIS|nr:hypothetical protein [Paralysiella testudinis]QRQ82861.1 hypothetical protein JQU52_05635 [Paralysiella testudinis]